MKQLLVLSGKGGTGKTTVASAFIRLANAMAYADCDVDAPNLHLIMEDVGVKRESDFYGMGKAVIDQTVCIQCGACKALCRFDSVIEENGFSIDPYACEGCGVCQAFVRLRPLPCKRGLMVNSCFIPEKRFFPRLN